jgi:hypothetical protein
MKCPHCNKSLWFNHPVCPYCKAAITPSSPTAPATIEGNNPEDAPVWVTFKQCETLGEADAIRAQLEAAGIAVFIPDETLMQAVAWNLNTYGFVRVQVAARDLEAATLEFSSEKPGPEEDPPEPGTDRAAIPLSWPMRWFAFLMPLLCCPGVFAFAVARGGYSRQGCDRKAREVWHWFAGGIVFWAVAFLIYVLVRGATI